MRHAEAWEVWPERSAGRDRHAIDGYGTRRSGAGTARIRQPGGAGPGQGGSCRARVIYILIGWVAILVALGQTSRHADQQGALQLLASKPYGLVLLWLLGIGFAGYALVALSGGRLRRHRRGSGSLARG